MIQPKLNTYTYVY